MDLRDLSGSPMASELTVIDILPVSLFIFLLALLFVFLLCSGTFFCKYC